MEAIAYIILHIFILLVFAKVLGGIFEKYKMPKLIGEILAGVVFINLALAFPNFFADVLHFVVDETSHLIDPALLGGEEISTMEFFDIMGEIGIIFLLFAVGLETKFGDLMKVGKTSMYIAVLGIAVPFIGGLLFVFHSDISFNMALLIGTALFGMSTAVSVECLRNLDAMGSNEAKIIVSASIIDDILCLALLGVITGVISGGSETVIILNTVIVAVFILSMFLFISRVKKLAARRKKLQDRIKKMRSRGYEACEIEDEKKSMTELSALGLAVIVCLGLATLSATIGLAAIIGAFLAGMLFAEFRDTVPVEHNFNVITYFMLPFFFIWVGMGVHLHNIEPSILATLGLLVIVAVITKYVAGYTGAKMGKLDRDSSHLIGVSMIPRGEVGIIVATIGLGAGVFTQEWFTVIILMALITSMITPPLVTRAYRKMEKDRSHAFEEIFIEEHTADPSPETEDK